MTDRSPDRAMDSAMDSDMGRDMDAMDRAMNRAMGRGAGFRPGRVALFVCLALLAVLFLAPTAGVLLSAFKTTRAIALGDLWSIPDTLFLGNFAEVLANPAVHTYFLNTLLVTAPATASTATTRPSRSNGRRDGGDAAAARAMGGRRA